MEDDNREPGIVPAYASWRDEYPQFTPNLTPREIFSLGSFGGTYWRPIFSGVNGRNYDGAAAEFAEMFAGIDPQKLSSPICNITRNKYGVAAGTSLIYWESKGWIKPQDPYGWVQWYCRFYCGRRSPDDVRQIDRWCAFAGPKGRFRNRLINLCKEAGTPHNDYSISPVIRQGLQQWAYVLTRDDM